MKVGIAVIDVDAVARTASVGVNRAWLFMGMGVNCANNADSIDIDLPEAAYLRLLPEDLPESTLEEAKVEFGVWIVSNGLRELIDTFDVFLGRTYDAALTVESWNAAQTGRQTNQASPDERSRQFSWFGTAKRLAALDDQFGISTGFSADVVSIRKARNCLTHRLGMVGREDVNQAGELVVQWHTAELYGVNPDGTDFVPSLEQLPIRFPVGSPVKVRHALREKRFSLGERLVLSAGELKHICYMFRLAIDEARGSFVQYAQRMGVQQVERQQEDGEVST